MTKKTELPQSRRHVLIFDEDWDFLSANYGPSGPKPIGVSAAIRKIVHSKCQGLRQRIADASDRSAQVDAEAAE